MDHPMKTARTHQGLSQAELARRSGLDPSTISKIEKGLRGSLWAYKRIAGVLGIDYRKLLPKDNAA